MKNLKKIVGIIALLIVILIIIFYFKSNSPEEGSLNNWKNYSNNELGVSFSYPENFELVKDEIHSEYFNHPKGYNWYRVSLVDKAAPERPSMLLEIDPDGWGPFILDKSYSITENSNNELTIQSVKNYDDEIINKDDKVWIFAGLKSQNGHDYSWHFIYNEGGDDYEQLFKQILSTFKFTKSILVDDDSGASKITKSTWGIAFDKLEGWETIRNNDDEVILSNSQDLITISHLVGAHITDSDSKLGNITFSYDESVGMWMEFSPNNLELRETVGSQPAENYQEFPNLKTGEPVFLGLSRWKTYIIPLSHNEFIKLNMTGTGNTEPLDQLLKSIEII